MISYTSVNGTVFTPGNVRGRDAISGAYPEDIGAFRFLQGESQLPVRVFYVGCLTRLDRQVLTFWIEPMEGEASDIAVDRKRLNLDWSIMQEMHSNDGRLIVLSRGPSGIQLLGREVQWFLNRRAGSFARYQQLTAVPV